MEEVPVFISWRKLPFFVRGDYEKDLCEITLINKSAFIKCLMITNINSLKHLALI